jgi:hypothetical protein
MQTLNYLEWKQHGIHYVQAIVDNKGAVMTSKELDDKRGMLCKYLQYHSLVAAIPNIWK